MGLALRAPENFTVRSVNVAPRLHRATNSLTSREFSVARQVIHNLGTIPNAGFTDANTDITVVFEGSYQAYQEQEAALTSLPPGRLQYSYVIHSMPMSMSEADLRNFAYTLSAHTGLFFLTDLSQDYYESFGPDWRGFIEAMPGSMG
jgi:hypothetical protein